jgi:hypothetical protein
LRTRGLRPDAASSLVFAIGIIDGMADGDCSIRLLRQSSVFMVARMGRTFGLVAVRNKSARAPDHPETETVE